jgi:hypothetical protein
MTPGASQANDENARPAGAGDDRLRGAVLAHRVEGLPRSAAERLGKLLLEGAFQGSKVFERGGPFTDLYGADVREAKRDPRLKESGRLTGFKFENMCFPREPKTDFYEWRYINALYGHREWLRGHIIPLRRFHGY